MICEQHPVCSNTLTYFSRWNSLKHSEWSERRGRIARVSYSSAGLWDSFEPFVMWPKMFFLVDFNCGEIKCCFQPHWCSETPKSKMFKFPTCSGFKLHLSYLSYCTRQQDWEPKCRHWGWNTSAQHDKLAKGTGASELGIDTEGLMR